MNRFALALAVTFAATACRQDTASTPPEQMEPTPATPAAANDPPPATTTPAPSDGAGATDAEAPTVDPADTAAVDTGPAKPHADPAAEITEPKDFAHVKLELKQADGKVYRDAKGIVIDWSVPTSVDIDFGGHKHALVLTAKRDGKAGVTVEIDYRMDGTEVLRSADLAGKLRERAVLRVEGGGALALTVVNKRVEPKPAAARDTLDKGETKDPLSGAEKKK